MAGGCTGPTTVEHWTSSVTGRPVPDAHLAHASYVVGKWTFPVTLDTRCLRREGMSLLVPLPDLQRGQVAPVRVLP
ncbi:hypothetical protein SHIRM173S_00697 [Streptomyces hirsutus]